MVMLFALNGTAIARFRTHPTQLSMKIRIASPETGTDVAHIGTVAAQLNALSHHLHHVIVSQK
jgi:hypothetical protein